MRKSSFILFLFVCIGLNLTAQTFTNSTEALGISEEYPVFFMGNGLCVIDLDENGWDDIVLLREDSGIIAYFNNEGIFNRQVLMELEGVLKALLFADMDNDGDQDFVVTRQYGHVQLFRNDGNLNFTDVSQAQGIIQTNNARTFGASWADVNLDGLIDLYICNYNQQGYTPFDVNDWYYQNMGGIFYEQSSLTGFTELTDPTFQSAFFPINSDVYPDLVTINDYAPRNSVYLSQALGSYVKSFSSKQENGQIDAMSLSVKDFDHDGDFDMYVSADELSGNQLFVNNDGLYINQASAFGVASFRFCVGSLWIDVNNDTWSDLYVADAETWDTESVPAVYERDELYMFDGSTFTPAEYIPTEGNEFNTYCVAKGDFNNDGFYDLVLGTSLDQGVQVLMNNADATENSWIKVELQGTISNRDGVGSLIEYFVGGNRFVEYTMCGENYLSQDSKTLILPLGAATQADSLFITWPSGTVDHYYNLTEHNRCHFIEGNYNLYASSTNGVLQICEGESVQLQANAPSNGTVLWSNGETTPTIVVDVPGNYWMEFIYPEGYSIFSNTITIGEGQIGNVNIANEIPSCYAFTDGSIAITIENSTPEFSILWNDGFDGFVRYDLSAGSYIATITNPEGCQKTYTIELAQPDFFGAFISSIPSSCYQGNDGQVLIESAFGGTEPYSVFVNNTLFSEGQSLASLAGLELGAFASGNYTVEILDANQCVQVQDLSIDEPTELSASSEINNGLVTITTVGGTEPYSFIWPLPDIEGPSATLPTGLYSVVIVDSNGCEVTLEIDVPIGVGELSADLIAGFLSNDQFYFNQFVEMATVFDMEGRIVKQETNISRVNFSELANGFYMIKVIGSDSISNCFKVPLYNR